MFNSLNSNLNKNVFGYVTEEDVFMESARVVCLYGYFLN